MSERVREILDTRLSTEWGVLTPIAWDDVEYVPEVGTQFIRSTLDGIASEILSMSCQREFYLMTIQVFTVAGLGSSFNLELADQLVEIFFRFAEENLLCSTIVVERVGSTNEWYQRNVLIDIQYDNHFSPASDKCFGNSSFGN